MTLRATIDSTKEDIEKRLRRWIGGKWPADQSLDEDVFDAAVEICQLRSQIRQIRLGIDPFKGDPPKWAISAVYE